MELSHRQYRIALICLALLGLAFALITTSKYGAGVSSDAVRAMSAAEGLLAGKGFVDFVGSPYVQWPPLYPLLLAGLSLLMRLDIFHVSWYLNLILFPLNIWLWGKLFERVFPDRLHYALFASLAALISSSMIRIYANVASDPLFVTMMILFFFTAADYLETASSRALWLVFVMAGLSTLQRYLGVVLFGVGGLVVLCRSGCQPDLRIIGRALQKLILPVGFTFLPTAYWLLVHNYLQNGTLFGPREYNEMLPLENIGLSLTKILHWFLPYLPGLKFLLLQPWTVLLPLIAVLITLNLKHKENWSAWMKALSGRYVWPSLVFALIYYFLLAYTVNTIDHRDLTSDRYYIVLFPILLIFLLLTVEHLIVPHLPRKRLFQLGAAALAFLWLLYPIYDLQGYLRLSLVNGEPSNYNIYNSSHFMDMKVTQVGRTLAQANPNATFYSNYVNLLWFQYKRPIHTLLPANNDLPQDQRLASLQATYPGWPGTETGFIIWYTPNEYKYLAPIDDLKLLAHLELIYEDDDGQIYKVSPK